MLIFNEFHLRKIPSIFLRFVIYHEVGFLPNPMTMCLKKTPYNVIKKKKLCAAMWLCV